ncbi:MAG: PhzF family phenazine biosynthesis protein [Candidatus Thorarchaeota archaeon]|nr:PhzF family phenazine biosynthesis protein [Candidatus Thorarchaeota archaeon]
MLEIPYIQTSVFVDPRYGFGGNQLATFWDAESNSKLDTEMMQGMALEMNFSESTFIEQPSNPVYIAKVRIFTPARELSFAGHPTIGTAYVLKERGIVRRAAQNVILELGIGPIPVDYLDDTAIRMKQNEPEFLDIWGDKTALVKALDVSPEDIDTRFPMQWVSTGFPFLMVPLKTLTAVERANPNPSEILRVLESQISKQIVLLCRETVNEDSDLHVRMFAPEVGVVEDPATGSAAGPLAAYTEQYDLLGRNAPGRDIVIEQGYEIKRPSRLIANVIGSQDFTGVYVSGLTRYVAKGIFYLE